MRHELDTRVTPAGEQDTLLGYPRTGRVVIEVADENGEQKTFVRARAALDAFHHPFVSLSPGCAQPVAA